MTDFRCVTCSITPHPVPSDLVDMQSTMALSCSPTPIHMSAAKRTGWQIFASCNFPPENDRIRPAVEKAIVQQLLSELAAPAVEAVSKGVAAL